MGKVEKEQLPENMRQMSAEERTVYVATKANERADIQARIHKLNVQRNQFIADQMKTRQEQGDTLGSAIKQSVREQAGRKNYTFKPVGEPTDVAESTPEKQ